MKASSTIKMVIGTAFIITGLVWSIMFPKTIEVLRPDFVASVAIGIGLVISGVLILFFKKSRVLQGVLSILLTWSLLMNAFLFCWAREAMQVMVDLVSNNLSTETNPRMLFDFSLSDMFGRNIRSQDYQGVPVFLEFGACW